MMNNVVKQIKRSFAVFSALFITVVTSKIRGHQNCGPERLVHCAKPLTVLTDSGLTFATSKPDLDRMCPDLKDALKCIHGYTRHCMSMEEQTHFKKLFHGTGLMVYELCKNGTYQREYLKYAPCMKKVEPENEVCLKTYTIAMKEIQSKTSEEESPVELNNFVTYQKKKREAADEGIKSVCCSFQQYVECSTKTMRMACGEEAAQFSREFLDKMSFNLLQLHCNNYGRKECGLEMAASFEFSSANTFSIISRLALALIPLIALVLS